MYTLKIDTINKDFSLPDNTEHLVVRFNVLKGKKVVHSARHGFPLSTTEKEIKAELQKSLETFIGEQEQAVENKKVEKLHKQADETIKNLENLEINAESNQ